MTKGFFLSNHVMGNMLVISIVIALKLVEIFVVLVKNKLSLL
jgi:hypothetical protein